MSGWVEVVEKPAGRTGSDRVFRLFGMFLRKPNSERRALYTSKNSRRGTSLELKASAVIRESHGHFNFSPVSSLTNQLFQSALRS